MIRPSSLWNTSHAEALDPLARLVYRSNLLGSEQRVTNTGGGNTSAKLPGRDPLSGKTVEVLWVKGSGGDLRTAGKDLFASLHMDRLNALPGIYQGMDGRGPKGAAEDAMVAMYPHCTYGLNPRAASIDTPLHAFVPYRHIDHMHPNAVISVAASRNAAELTRTIYGDDLVWIPWQRPGFDLGLQLQEVCRQHPRAKGVIMGQHGVINWADDDRACYELTMDIIHRAERHIAGCDLGPKTFGGAQCRSLSAEGRKAVLSQILPWLRGRISAVKRWIGTVQDDETMLRFVNSVDASRLSALGTSCPDHFLRTKIKPLYVPWVPDTNDVGSLRTLLEQGIEQYRADYAAYYKGCRHDDSPAMRDPNPTVILIPGVGMIAWGKDKSESRVTAEFYNCAVEVMRGAEAMDEYIALPQQEAFDIEYWLLEEAKLKRMPAEKELSRRIIAVIGAGSGIGRETCKRLARDGAQVVCVDVDRAAAESAAKEITDISGIGIGVAGSGLSGCGPALGLAADITDRAGIRRLFDEVLLAYGGLDGVVITAGITVPTDASGHIPDDKWALTFAINVTGAYLVADEAARIWREQGLRANLVMTTSANGVVAKKGMLAYDTSKAAANHLVRELAIELAPLVRVNAVAPATVVQGSSMFPRERVLSSLAKYAIRFDQDESTEDLRNRLAEFYAGRTLTKQAILPSDQAEAIYILMTERLAKTTGQIIMVDGGLQDAFLR